MQSTTFYKYQGTGNDFIIIDDRQEQFSKKDTKLTARLCDRKFGIGADGLILLQNNRHHNFTMVYFNADGNESSMCGNGGRCIASFARFLGVATDTTTFEAIDGLHHAKIFDNGNVSLQMMDVKNLQLFDGHVFTNTGSPHHVELTDNIEHVDVFNQGRHLRTELYGKEGANINFVQPVTANTFKVRTYERGVEDETLSCGTGVTAVALAMHKTGQTTLQTVELQTPGGHLQVTFDPTPTGYENIWLTGHATQVFKGTIDL
ncbi:diaminopimelate epimerase [Nonlabens sp. Hel1_33_55]|uniref:diaminopimelate epimerase n=1 Tax=Nonlabens sp. Hel1_33_55 TaxID=1336802 RepID=UPI000875DD1B|nr:diaminopimelate epimerase [Nonlabens sp. Hel1_33_55]SCY09776.1 diaminopimelate epimerase [Nonlabens sp. Hel1_33_55]